MTKKKQPIFEKIAEDIRKKVNEGYYVTAQKLPSEYDLADEYNISRLTVRKAINLLINQNVLIKLSGKGTYVIKPHEQKKGSSELIGFSEAARFYGDSPSTKVISVEQITTIPEKIAEALEATEMEEIIHVVRLRSLNEKPMTIENLYIYKRYLTETSKEALEESIFDQIEKNIEIAYSHQEVEAVLATEETSELLEIEKNAPLLKSVALTYSPTAKPILYDETLYRGDEYSIKTILHRSQG